MPPGSAKPSQPSRDVHPVTEDVVVLHHDVALVNADTKFDAFIGSDPDIGLDHTALPFGRTTQCINHTGKFDQQAVTGSFNDAAPVFSNCRVYNFRPDRPQPVEGTFLVSPYKP